MLGKILVTFITIVVGVNLVPSVANGVQSAVYENRTNGSTLDSTNVTGAGASITLLIPLFFILGIVIATIYSTMAVLSKMGL